MLFCFVACFLSLGIGVMFAWPTSTLTFSDSKITNLNRHISDIELLLLFCLPILGAIISIPIAGICLDRLGRKYSAIMFSTMCTLSWAILACSNTVEIVLTALFISGLSGAMFVITPFYISETCRDFIREALTGGCIALYELGMVISYILAAYLDYHSMIYSSFFMSAVGTLSMCTLKESPVFLLAKGMEYEAAKSIAFYRGTKPNSIEVVKELNEIRRTFISAMDLPDTNNKQEMSESAELPFGNLLETFKFIKKSRSTRRALFVIMVLMSSCVFQGVIIVQAIADRIFEAALPNVPGSVCFVLMIIMTVFVAFVSVYLTDLYGRRPLMIYSSFATGISCILLGTQIQMEWGPAWLTAVLVVMFTLVYTLGAGTVPHVFIHEVFLPEVKCVTMVLVMEWLMICFLINYFILIPIMEFDFTVGLSTMFYISTVDCIFTIGFCVLYLPETKGLSMKEIQVIFNKQTRLCARDLMFWKNTVAQ